jgi:penicillin-binding protein 1A
MKAESRFSGLLLTLLSLGLLSLVVGIGFLIGLVGYYGRDLPNHVQLQNYDPPVVTRLYAGNGKLLAEYAEEKRIFIPIQQIPDNVKNAFIAAEDQNFYSHGGVDYFAIARAIATNIKNVSTGRRPIGASTITQQVAKNFLLTNEVSVTRKIKEAILATRMEKILSKDRILELYLNEIYLGIGTYGVGAAAQNYFNKSLDELGAEEAAYLASLPKAPNNYHPIKRYEKAVARRNWVLERMVEDGYIQKADLKPLQSSPLKTVLTEKTEGGAYAPYFAESVRRDLEEKFGKDILYEGGLAVRTSVEPDFQALARESLQQGLMEYDRRHGWRGALESYDSVDAAKAALPDFKRPDAMLEDWDLAIITHIQGENATIFLPKHAQRIEDEEVQISPVDVKWSNQSAKRLRKGDLIMIKIEEKDGKKDFRLKQIPKIQGALVALDPYTGRVLAMQGGWKYGTDQFNRVTQAQRQPGSAFKPFIYLAALDNGFTPSTLILDGPVALPQGPGLPLWRPKNYKEEFYGPTPLRVGLEKSKNLMTVRLANYVGMPKVVEYAKKFGVVDTMPAYISMSLGSMDTTLMRMTAAYATFVNGGYRVHPSFVDRIQDRTGKTIYSRDTRQCVNCGPLVRWENQSLPTLPAMYEQIADPRTAYQITSILEGVVQNGTAVKLKELNRPLAGKTGTTNDSKDAWFIGFSPNLAVGVYIGYDTPKSLGAKETGSSVAVPVFKQFMEQALKNVPITPFPKPDGVRQVRINHKTGMRAQGNDSNVIWEHYIAGTEPEIGANTILGANGIRPYGAGSVIEPDFPDLEQGSPYQNGGVVPYAPNSPTQDSSSPPPQDSSPPMSGTAGFY